MAERAIGKLPQGQANRRKEFRKVLGDVGWKANGFPQGVGPFLSLLLADDILDQKERIFGGIPRPRGQVTLVPGSMAHRGPKVAKDESEGNQEQEKEQGEQATKKRKMSNARAVLFFTATPPEAPGYSK